MYRSGVTTVGIDVLFIVPRLFPHISGVKYVVKSVASELIRRGLSMAILAGEPDCNAPLKEEVYKLTVYR